MTTIPDTDELLVVECDRCHQTLGETEQWTYPDESAAWLAAVEWGWLPLPEANELVCHTCQARAHREQCRTRQHVLGAWEESGGLWHRTCTWCSATQVQTGSEEGRHP